MSMTLTFMSCQAAFMSYLSVIGTDIIDFNFCNCTSECNLRFSLSGHTGACFCALSGMVQSIYTFSSTRRRSFSFFLQKTIRLWVHFRTWARIVKMMLNYVMNCCILSVTSAHTASLDISSNPWCFLLLVFKVIGVEFTVLVRNLHPLIVNINVMVIWSF